MASTIYDKKTLWKQILMLVALLIVAGSFWYTNFIVQRLAEEERSKVRLWAEAVQRRAKLVGYTNRLFKDLGDEEEQRMELWVEATESIPKSLDIALATKVIEYNTHIPIIQVNEAGEILSSRNIPGVIEPSDPRIQELGKAAVDSLNRIILIDALDLMVRKGKRIEVNYYADAYNYLYYGESLLFKELKKTFNEIQNGFIADVVNQMGTTPVVLATSNLDSVLAFTNIPESQIAEAKGLQETVLAMEDSNEPIRFSLGDDKQEYVVYYSNSLILEQLKYYPFIQFGVIGLFIIIGYYLFSIARRSEQNQVWVGMSKETAHQLGTPLSSIMGWVELLRAEEQTKHIADEMDKDIHRFEVITERFSKIGSRPELKPHAVGETIEEFFDYLRKRVSDKIELKATGDLEAQANLNKHLFEWVIENLSKNAIDALEGKPGSITAHIQSTDGKIIIEVSDTGKGIPYGKRKRVFQPGYTSKKRGWGLGLSLTKRIIESYHNGKIVVKSSEVGKGTTFRIILTAS